MKCSMIFECLTSVVYSLIESIFEAVFFLSTCRTFIRELRFSPSINLKAYER